MIREKTVFFSGHRPERFPKYEPEEFKALIARLRTSISEAIDIGYSHFICGMASGWDIMSGEAVLYVRKNSKLHITLELAIPFQGHPDRRKLTSKDKSRYDYLLKEADTVTFYNESYYKGVFNDRDIYMADSSTLLICFWDGGPGGTSRAVKYALEQKLKIINLYDGKEMVNA